MCICFLCFRISYINKGFQPVCKVSRLFFAQKNPFRYQGQYFDPEVDLYYNRFRYYDCESGVYISQDLQGLSGGKELYSYVPDVNSWLDIFGLAKCRNGKKTGPKIKGEGGPHNDKIGEIADQMEKDGYTITEGGNRMKEKLRAIFGGKKKGRRPDVVGVKDGKEKAYNVGKKKLDGKPIKREQDALDDLKSTGLDIDFIPYNE